MSKRETFNPASCTPEGWLVTMLVVGGMVLLSACIPPSRPTPMPTPTPVPSSTFTPTPEPPPPEPTPTPTPELSPLILWHDLPDEQATQLAVEISQFEAGHQGVGVDMQRYDSEPKLEEALLKGSIDFDVVLGNARVVGFMRDRQLAQAIDPLFDEEFLRGLARPGLEGVAYQGYLWGVPHTLGMQLMLFYHAGRVSQPPADTAALLELASRWTGPDGYGLGMNSLDPLWLLPWLSAYGGWPTDEQGYPTLNTEPMIRALSFLQSLALERKVMSATADYDTGLEAFKTGKTTFWIDGEWVLGTLGEVKDVQWGVARLPVLTDTGLEPACLIAGKYFIVGAHVGGPQLEAARLLIEQLAGVEGQKRWTAAFRTMPSSLAVLNDKLIQDDPFMRLSAAQVLAGRGIGLSSGLQEAMNAMRGPLEDMLYGRLAPSEAARGMQARAEALSRP